MSRIVVDATPENLAAFRLAEAQMAAEVPELLEAALRDVWKLTIRMVDEASTPLAKSRLLGERSAVRSEIIRRGWTAWQIATFWS